MPDEQVTAVASDEIHVWWISLDGDAPPWHSLSPGECARASSLRDPFARHFVIARTARRSILSRYTGQNPAHIEFRDGLYGKPSIVSSPHLPDIRFNVSHSGDLLCCAVASGREVGVDIELVRPIPEADAIARMLFTPAEREEALSLARGRGEDWFLRCWVRKEALLKATGLGIAGNASPSDTITPERWTVRDLAAVEGYVAAVAVEGTECDVRQFSLVGEESDHLRENLRFVPRFDRVCGLREQT